MEQNSHASTPAHHKFADMPDELFAAIVHYANPRSLVPATTRVFADALARKSIKRDWLDSLLAHRVPVAWKERYVAERGLPGDVGALLEYAKGEMVGPDQMQRAGFDYCDPDDERAMASLTPILADHLLDLAQPA
ncbi:hypothetical protein H9P43_009286 [Blastocladiella emersonii ATCC 22665]|nr:hypothetical protein H9P43_009286 [Blastocladiella emersonii ATCC 22665]